MSPVDRDFITNKFAQIIENLRELEDIYKLGWKHFQDTKNTRKLAERYLQETIEILCDINAHLLVETRHGAPKDYYESFIKLGEHGFVSSDLAQELAPCSGVRNRIVHEYDRIDSRMIYDSIEKAMQLFPTYIEAIRKSLSYL